MTMASYSGKDARASIPDALDISSLSVDAAAPAQSSESVRMYPQPMEALHSNVPPPFLTKTYEMVDDPSTNAIVSWSPTNNSFIVWDPSLFSQQLLPRYFKHGNFQSFVRQLNTYGFRKVDPDRWEFRNEGFLRGQKHLLKTIHRRKPVSSSQSQSSLSKTPQLNHCVEVGNFGLEGEIEQLKRDKNVLMMELVKLRQQQTTTEKELMSMGQRLQITEQRQQQMMSFLAKAIRSPNFLSLLMQQTENHHIKDARKKRRLPGQSEEVQMNAFQPPVTGQLVKYDSGNMDILSSPLWPQAEILSNPTNSFSNEVFFEKTEDSGSQQARATEFPLIAEEIPGDTVNDLKNDSDFDFDLGDLDTDSTILDEFLSSAKEDAATDMDDFN